MRAEDAGLPPAPCLTGGILTIDLANLAANWRDLARLSGSACAAVVKADAYGLGTEPVTRALMQAGCETFFVAHIAEAMRVRTVAPQAAIYVLNGLLPGAAPAFASHALRPVLGSLAEIAEWRAFCAAAATALPAAVHLDTGMNRLGLTMEEAALFSQQQARAPAFPLALIMSHLVTAEVPGHPLNGRQIERFTALRTLFPGTPTSLANSSGIFLGDAARSDLARPGYALYGGNPIPGKPNPMRPVVRLDVHVIQVRRVAAGDTVGYNARWTAAGERRIATLSIGYADGYPRAATTATDAHGDTSPGGVALVHGQPCPFAGVVSMDLITLDITALPEGSVKPGDLVNLIGGNLDLDAVARGAGTIGYEILTNLGRRHARHYLGA